MPGNGYEWEGSGTRLLGHKSLICTTRILGYLDSSSELGENFALGYCPHSPYNECLTTAPHNDVLAK